MTEEVLSYEFYIYLDGECVRASCLLATISNVRKYCRELAATFSPTGTYSAAYYVNGDGQCECGFMPTTEQIERCEVKPVLEEEFTTQ